MTLPHSISTQAYRTGRTAFVIITLLLSLGGGWYYRMEAEKLRQEKYHELAAIGELKVQQIQLWRSERQMDARRLARSALTRKAVTDFLRQPDDLAVRTVLRTDLQVEQVAGEDEDVLLFTRDGNLLLAATDHPETTGPALRLAMASALTNQEPVFSDFYGAQTGRIFLDLAVAVRDTAGTPLAVMVVRRDPNNFLYPLVQAWPTPSRSAETVLCQRDGKEVLFVNVLRHATNAAMSLRFPLTRTDLPAVHALLGKRGIVEGLDYRGVPVLTDLQLITNSAWFIVTKIDKAEALAANQKRALEIMLIIGLFVALGLTAGFRHHHVVRIFDNLREADRLKLAAQETFRATLYSIGDGVITTDTAGRVQAMNAVAEKLTGCTEAEARGRPLTDIFQIINETTREPIANPAQTALHENKAVALANHTILIARDGREYPIADSAAPIRSAEGNITGVVLVFSDQSRQQAAQQGLRASEEQLRATFEQVAIGMSHTSLDGHFLRVNERLCSITGYAREELLQKGFQDITHPDDLDGDLALMHQLLAGTIPTYTLEKRYRRKDGTAVPISLTVALVRDEAGQPRYFIAAVADITARKQAEEALARSQTYLKAIVDNEPECVKVLDRNGCLLDMNPAGLAMIEADSLEQVRGQRMCPLLQTETDQTAFDEMLAAVFRGETRELTFEIVGLKGTHCWLESHSVPQWDARHEKVESLLAVTRDITARKQAEEHLHLLKRSIDLHFDGAYWLNTSNEVVYVNDAGCQALGYAREELIGRSVKKINPNVTDETLKQVWEQLRTNKFFHAESRHYRKDGSEFPVEIVGTYVQFRGREFNCGFARDITARKQAEEQLSVQFSALTAAANGIAITDRQGKIEWVNPAFTKLTGYRAEEAIGHNPRVLKSGQHPPAFYATLWATVLTGNVWHGELINKRKDGRLYTEEMTITPVRGADGQISHFVAIKQDVTDRRRLDNQIQKAQKMEAIGTLAGGIAHDFNNILAAIFGFIELLQQDTAGNPPAQECLAEILTAANRAKDLVKQILTFSRQGDQKREVIHLDVVVKEAMKFLRASLPAHIKVEMSLAADAPAVLADPTQVYQVVLNLATNALHAMEDRPGQIVFRLESFFPDEKFLSAHLEFKPVAYARLSVADTGCGMEVKTMERMFEPFFTTKPVGKGTGLGLAVVHGIVESHGGLISVESQAGVGTTFHLYFPAEMAEVAKHDGALSALPRGQGQHILVVDDETALTVMYQRLLQRLNYQVTCVNRAPEAIGLFVADPARFDLMLTDLTMPDMNGVELAGQVHTLRPDLPILLASGFTSNLDPEKLRAAGICELVEKPIGLNALAETLARSLQKLPPPAT